MNTTGYKFFCGDASKIFPHLIRRHQGGALQTELHPHKMTDVSNPLISKLSLEAKRFIEKRTASTSSHCDLHRKIARLTGISINADLVKGDPKLENIKRRLQAGLRQERKNGRAGSPLYDSNRHIALNETLKQIAALQTKKNADLSDCSGSAP